MGKDLDRYSSATTPGEYGQEAWRKGAGGGGNALSLRALSHTEMTLLLSPLTQNVLGGDPILDVVSGHDRRLSQRHAAHEIEISRQGRLTSRRISRMATDLPAQRMGDVIDQVSQLGHQSVSVVRVERMARYGFVQR